MVQWMQGRNRAHLLALSFLLVLSAGALGLTALGGGSPIKGVQKVADAAAVLAMRSPGERDEAALSKKGLVKAGISSASLAAPISRRPILAATVPGELPILSGGGVLNLEFAEYPPVPEVALFEQPVEPDIFESPPVLLPGGFPEGPPPLVIGPGGGGVTPPGVIPPGPGPTPPGVVPETPPVPPVSAVPEPATWLMMLIGFGAIGRAMRKRSSRIGAKAGLANG